MVHHQQDLIIHLRTISDKLHYINRMDKFIQLVCIHNYLYIF